MTPFPDTVSYFLTIVVKGGYDKHQISEIQNLGGFMGTATKIQRNYQITLPVAVRKKAHIQVGDFVDFEVREDGILLKPLATIDRAQLWFWQTSWQNEEQKVQQDFQKGHIKVSKSVKAFLDELER